MKNKHLYRRLVVIGNGFDRAHKLPTEYSDFMKQLTEEHAKFYNTICQYIPGDSLWASFEEALAELDDEQLQDDNSCYLLGYGDENWRDSAHHDFQYMIGEALSFASDVPHYFSKWIRSIDTDVPPIMPAHIVDKSNLYLSFNYTDTLEMVYNIPTKNILYIRGKARRGDELIVGHHSNDLVQDETEPQFNSEEERQIYYDNYDEDIRVTEAKEIIKSYFKSTYKDTETIIKANQGFFNSLSQISEIYIYGHSLSDIDFAYFDEINNSVSPCCKWYISYHSESDYKKAEKFVKALNIPLYQFFKS
mgnify:FL=1